MKILVPVKRVIDYNVKPRVKSDGTGEVKTEVKTENPNTGTETIKRTKAKAEKTLKLEIDDEAFERVYGLQSHPIRAQRGQRVAVRVISQFGEECTKVLVL